MPDEVKPDPNQAQTQDAELVAESVAAGEEQAPLSMSRLTTKPRSNLASVRLIALEPVLKPPKRRLRLSLKSLSRRRQEQAQPTILMIS